MTKSIGGSEFGDFLDERLNALRTLDVAWARREAPGAPGASSDDVRLVALHKARYRCREIEVALRHESAEWLRVRGCGDLFGEPLLPPGQLP
ncbi:hypothetical protein [Methylibium rhizosphaerae]|uniref:hypothetical protein n=1 Tax=Methylibium rhizosphaerae TaxID=2570323 RepID=UPI0011284D36|nr:hypothetical protein [Methylibium rhizosphaerae]